MLTNNKRRRTNIPEIVFCFCSLPKNVQETLFIWLFSPLNGNQCQIFIKRNRKPISVRRHHLYERLSLKESFNDQDEVLSSSSPQSQNPNPGDWGWHLNPMGHLEIFILFRWCPNTILLDLVFGSCLMKYIHTYVHVSTLRAERERERERELRAL